MILVDAATLSGHGIGVAFDELKREVGKQEGYNFADAAGNGEDLEERDKQREIFYFSEFLWTLLNGGKPRDD